MFSAYDAGDIQILSTALQAAMDVLETATSCTRTEIETSNMYKRITDNLLKEFDLGVRDASALNRAALEGIDVSAENG